MASVIPVDQSAWGTLSLLSDGPKLDQDGTQRTTKDGVPQRTLQVLLVPKPSSDPVQSQKAELLTVTMASRVALDLLPMTVISFENLVARAWDMNGKSGIAFSATALTEV